MTPLQFLQMLSDMGLKDAPAALKQLKAERKRQEKLLAAARAIQAWGQRLGGWEAPAWAQLAEALADAQQTETQGENQP